jgi:glycosyltransferase involved in cell wall biosynthesis
MGRHTTSDAAPPLILHVIPGMMIGGIARAILETLGRADRGRFRFHVLSTDNRGHWADRLPAMGIPFTYQKPRPLTKPWRFVRFVDTIRRIRPALVHDHYRPSVIPVAHACWLLGGIPHVIHYHNGQGDYEERVPPLFLRMESRVTRAAAARIAVSRSAADANADALGIRRESVQVIYNGVAREQFGNTAPCDTLREWQMPPTRPLVVQVGRLIGFKGPTDFVAAAAKVLKEWPSSAGPRPAFLLVGDGPSRGECERLIDALGVRGDVVLAGFREDVPAILAAASVGVFASTGNEGLGQALMQYMASRVPIAATSLPSATEVLRDGVHALLSPPHEPDLLAANILQLLADLPTARALAERAEAEVLPMFDWGRTERECEELYARILRMPAAG